jgi:hypothetical protein
VFRVSFFDYFLKITSKSEVEWKENFIVESVEAILLFSEEKKNENLKRVKRVI